MMQCQDWTKDVVYVGPDLYASGEWMNPPWLSG